MNVEYEVCVCVCVLFVAGQALRDSSLHLSAEPILVQNSLLTVYLQEVCVCVCVNKRESFICIISTV